MPELSEVEIFTDGACRGNPGPGGWAAILRYRETDKELSGFDPDTTNNRMEMTAAIVGLETLKRPCRVRLYSDSQYLRDGITKWINGWKRRGLADRRQAPGQECRSVAAPRRGCRPARRLLDLGARSFRPPRKRASRRAGARPHRRSGLGGIRSATTASAASGRVRRVSRFLPQAAPVTVIEALRDLCPAP